MSEDKTVKTVERKDTPNKRKERQPITGVRMKLQLTGEEPGFHYAWINDEFVGTAQDAGYEFVSHPIKVGNRHINVSDMQGSKIARNVGGGVVAYLMRVPQEWYDEDMALEQKVKVDALEEQLFIDNNSNGLTGTVKVGKTAWQEDTPNIFKK